MPDDDIDRINVRDNLKLAVEHENKKKRHIQWKVIEKQIDHYLQHWRARIGLENKQVVVFVHPWHSSDSLSIHSSVNQTIHLSINPFICQSIHSSVNQSIHLSILPEYSVLDVGSILLETEDSICQSTLPFICESIHPSFTLSISPSSH